MLGDHTRQWFYIRIIFINIFKPLQSIRIPCWANSNYSMSQGVLFFTAHFKNLVNHHNVKVTWHRIFSFFVFLNFCSRNPLPNVSLMMNNRNLDVPCETIKGNEEMRKQRWNKEAFLWVSGWKNKHLIIYSFTCLLHLFVIPVLSLCLRWFSPFIDSPEKCSISDFCSGKFQPSTAPLHYMLDNFLPYFCYWKTWSCRGSGSKDLLERYQIIHALEATVVRALHWWMILDRRFCSGSTRKKTCKWLVRKEGTLGARWGEEWGDFWNLGLLDTPLAFSRSVSKLVIGWLGFPSCDVYEHIHDQTSKTGLKDTALFRNALLKYHVFFPEWNYP